MADESSEMVNVVKHMCNTFSNIFLGAVTFVCCIYASYLGSIITILNIDKAYSQHMTLCVIGYVLLLPQAAMVFSEHNGWSRALKDSQKRLFHLILTVTGSSLAITGSFIIINWWPGQHFNTAHAVFGLISLILVALTLIGSLVHFFANPQNRFLKICYTGIWGLTLVFSLTALCFSLKYDTFIIWVSNDGANTLIGITVIGLFGVLLTLSNSITKI